MGLACIINLHAERWGLAKIRQPQESLILYMDNLKFYCLHECCSY